MKNYNTSGTSKKQKKASIEQLVEWSRVTNLLDEVKEDTAAVIAQQVLSGYQIDSLSCEDLRKTAKEGLDIVEQITEPKTFPWPGAANIKYPLVATACIQFAARVYPQLMNEQGGIVKAKVLGEDAQGLKEQRADRIGKHMSWQLAEQMTEWEEDMDKLFHMLPAVGTVFKKTYFCPIRGRNFSLVLSPFDVTVNDKHKGAFADCRRISHDLWLYKNDVVEREMSGLFSGGISDLMDTANEDEAELFIEQHMWYDLDGDGYAEPYIMTIHEASGKPARLVANYDVDTIKSDGEDLIRIGAVEYFTKYSFIPRASGGVYDLGFAHILGPINETMSTLINQLLDAGTLANTGGGFIDKRLRLPGGNMTFGLGEWKPVEVLGGVLKDGLVPNPIRDPSNVLFQLLSMLDEAGQKLASVTDLMTGETPSQNTPATTVLTLIDQGMKVFSSIYKRIHRAMKQELKKLYRLNSIHLDADEYFIFQDIKGVVSSDDYAMDDLDIVPVADPTISSQAAELARAQALLQTLPSNPEGRLAILTRYYKAIKVNNVEELVEGITAAQQQPPPPNLDLLKIQLETQKAKDEQLNRMEELRLENVKYGFEIEKLLAEIEVLKSQVLVNISKANSTALGDGMAQTQQTAEMIERDVELDAKGHDLELAKQNSVPVGQAPVMEETGSAGDIAEPEGGAGGVPGGGEAVPADMGLAEPPMEEPVPIMEGGEAPPRPDQLAAEQLPPAEQPIPM